MGLEWPKHVLRAGETRRAELLLQIRQLAIQIEPNGSFLAPSCLLLKLLAHFGPIHESIELLLQRCYILFEDYILYGLFTR